MGYQAEGLRISVRLSRHNDEHDSQDDKMWSDFKEDVEQLVKEYQRAGLQVDM
jgi:hypothetical protein